METGQLTQGEYESHIAQKTLRLSFVGMSNAGKSYRAKVLHRECDFFWYRVDEEIGRSLGFETEEGISSWLGYPSSDGYAQRERTYLDLENTFTGYAAQYASGKNLVFDTTGSVVHLEPTTLNALREYTLVVHLDVGDDSLEKLIEKFFQNPKPVAWSGHFSMEGNESEEQALRRSYPSLLTARLEKYRALAHLNVPAERLYNTSGQETLDIIKTYLPQ